MWNSGCNVYSIDEAIFEEKTYFAVLLRKDEDMVYYTCEQYPNRIDIDEKSVKIVNHNELTSSWEKQINTHQQNPFCLPECISWDINDKWIATGSGGKLTLWAI